MISFSIKWVLSSSYQTLGAVIAKFVHTHQLTRSPYQRVVLFQCLQSVPQEDHEQD